MQLNKDLLEELTILALFNEHTFQEGIKVHGHKASEQDVSATKRLYEKGLVTKVDGGYPTSLGKDAVDHLYDLVKMIKKT